MTLEDELQYLLNKSYTHIIKQGKRCISATNVCVYRNEEGLGCAAAPFILTYDREMEGGSFAGIVARFPKSYFDHIAVKHLNFVNKLQAFHDSNALHNSITSEDPFIPRYKQHVSESITVFNESNNTSLTIPEL